MKSIFKVETKMDYFMFINLILKLMKTDDISFKHLQTKIGITTLVDTCKLIENYDRKPIVFQKDKNNIILKFTDYLITDDVLNAFEKLFYKLMVLKRVTLVTKLYPQKEVLLIDERKGNG